MVIEKFKSLRLKISKFLEWIETEMRLPGSFIDWQVVDLLGGSAGQREIASSSSPTTGHLLAGGVLRSLHRRRRFGSGRRLDVSELQQATAWHEKEVESLYTSRHLCLASEKISGWKWAQVKAQHPRRVPSDWVKHGKAYSRVGLFGFCERLLLFHFKGFVYVNSKSDSSGVSSIVILKEAVYQNAEM